MCRRSMRAALKMLEGRWMIGPGAARAWLLAAMSAAVLPTTDAWRVPTPHRRDPAAMHGRRTACQGARAELPETLVFGLQSGAFPGSGHPDVAVHVPAGFDATRRPGLIVYFHGWRGCVEAAMSAGDVSCHEGGDRLPGSAIASQVDEARVNALAVAVELRPEMSTGEPGNLASPGGFHELLRELLSERLAPYLGCPIEVDALDRVVVVAHSGGYQAAASVLALGDVPEIREVVLLDALYGAQDVFLRWMGDSADEDSLAESRRFVDIYTCCSGTAEASRAMAERTRRASSAVTFLAPPLGDQVAFPAAALIDESDRELDATALAHRWLFKRVARPHDALPREFVTIIARSAGFAKL